MNKTPTPDEAYRELSKFLNEGCLSEVDKRCLAIILYEYYNLKRWYDSLIK